MNGRELTGELESRSLQGEFLRLRGFIYIYNRAENEQGKEW